MYVISSPVGYWIYLQQNFAGSASDLLSDQFAPTCWNYPRHPVSGGCLSRSRTGGLGSRIAYRQRVGRGRRRSRRFQLSLIFSLDFWLVTTQGVRCELGYGTAVDLQADVKENPFRVVVQMHIHVQMCMHMLVYPWLISARRDSSSFP